VSVFLQNILYLRHIDFILLLLTATGLMPGGSIYKDHTFNKETAPTSHETAHTSHDISTVQYKCINIHSTIQVKVKLSLYRPWRPLMLREVRAPTFSDIRLIDGGKVVSLMRRLLFTPRIVEIKGASLIY
jgi:hypothetical protein